MRVLIDTKGVKTGRIAKAAPRTPNKSGGGKKNSDLTGDWYHDGDGDVSASPSASATMSASASPMKNKVNSKLASGADFEGSGYDEEQNATMDGVKSEGDEYEPFGGCI